MFEKDFGYLIPFLRRVAQAGEGLPHPAARAELDRLLEGEPERWQRIRALLAGAAATPPRGPAPSRQPPSAASTGRAPHAPSFSIGSLRRT